MFQLTRQEQFIIGVLVLFVAAALIGVTVAGRAHQPGYRVDVPGYRDGIPLNTAAEGGVEEGDGPDEAPGTLVVHVAGEVAAPGTFELPVGARIRDAVSRAVPTKAADVNALNLAAKLIDGEKIVVPARGDPTSSSPGNGATGNAVGGGLIDLNTATQAELETLPGIGPSRARDIIDYRRGRRFRRVEDVMEVPGIGPGTYQKIKGRVAAR